MEFELPCDENRDLVEGQFDDAMSTDDSDVDDDTLFDNDK